MRRQTREIKELAKKYIPEVWQEGKDDEGCEE